MLAIFNKGLVDPPKELNSPASHPSGSGNKPKYPQEIVRMFQQSYPQNAPLSIGFGDSAFLAYSSSKGPQLHQQRIFCGMDNMYCIFLGNLNNLNTLIKQYGLGKATNEAMFVIEAYRTLRDRGPYPADQVLKDLEGCFGFVIYDGNAGTVFAALGADQRVKLYWGIAADESVVISDNLDVIKASCAKSFAPFPSGCMYHSEVGLMSFEHPKNKMKAMPRIDSEGAMCGANFKVDISSKKATMPRVGSEANWALSGSQA
ncbi:stem-specific protein TSJT1-like [Chenopodium quinoa]|uniref:stem-specific protein TSJT1-like n=1 Tax=Chenopodium quinoa TaxID=63459 RepID=UPI000B78F9DF|nr:stem-specific protein TSJT1-like [Chenopodium quinoa]